MRPLRLPAFALLTLAVLACERATARRADTAAAAVGAARTAPAVVRAKPSDEFPLLDSMPALVADDVAVASVDSAGLGGIPMCAPLDNVNLVYANAKGMAVYCAEDGCDVPYPAKVALTKAGDTLRWESSPASSSVEEGGKALVYYAWTTSRNVTSRHGVRPGMTVGQILALGETLDLSAAGVSEGIVVREDGKQDTIIAESPRVLTIRLPRDGIVAEVQHEDTVAKYFSRNLRAGRPPLEALDTAVRVDAVGVLRERCR